MTLEWIRHHPEAVGSHSKCRNYSVCRTDTDGKRWEVWRLAPGGPWFAQIAKDLPSEEAAQKFAENDPGFERKRA